MRKLLISLAAAAAVTVAVAPAIAQAAPASTPAHATHVAPKPLCDSCHDYGV
jgi:hypothetical protein